MSKGIRLVYHFSRAPLVAYVRAQVMRGAPSGLLQAVMTALAASDIDLEALGFAWARAMPAIAVVPAFGLRAVPAPARAAIALAMAASFWPAAIQSAPVHPTVPNTFSVPWPLLLVGEVLRGLPIALAAALPLWAATMAGGLVDSLRGVSDTLTAPTVEGRPTPFGVLFSSLASAFFLLGGGPSRVAMALCVGEIGAHPLLEAAHQMVLGINLAVALGAPLLASSFVLHAAAALIARAATPASVESVLAPLRAVGLLAIMALVLDRIASVLATTVIPSP